MMGIWVYNLFTLKTILVSCLDTYIIDELEKSGILILFYVLLVCTWALA
jgi:hypothetical protein